MLHRILLYIDSLLIIMTNVIVFFLSHKIHKRERIEMMSLAVSDLLMGVYLSAMSLTDIITLGEFNTIAIWWRQHFICKMLSAINVISVSVSISTVTFISGSRAYNIVSMTKVVHCSRSFGACILLWACCSTYAGVISYLHFVYNIATNNMCLLFRIHDQAKIDSNTFNKGNQILYATILAILMMMITICYAYIWQNVWRSRQRVQKHTTKRLKSNMSVFIKISILLLSNFTSWLPLFIMLIVSITNVLVSSKSSNLIVIVVMPISAILNPMIYTIIPSILAYQKVKPQTINR